MTALLGVPQRRPTCCGATLRCWRRCWASLRHKRSPTMPWCYAGARDLWGSQRRLPACRITRRRPSAAASPCAASAADMPQRLGAQRVLQEWRRWQPLHPGSLVCRCRRSPHPAVDHTTAHALPVMPHCSLHSNRCSTKCHSKAPSVLYHTIRLQGLLHSGCAGSSGLRRARPAQLLQCGAAVQCRRCVAARAGRPVLPHAQLPGRLG